MAAITKRFLFAISILATIGCLTASAQSKKLLGGDASLLPSYEQQGTVYKDFNGQKVRFLPFVRQQGWNMIRVRLFVDPQNAPEGHKGEGVCQDLNYVIGLCRQIKKAGISPEMIQVGNEITNGMLWPTGHLYPKDGDKPVDSSKETMKGRWDTLCNFLTAGSRACREVCPKAQIIIHTEKAGDWDVTRNYYQ